MLSDKCLPVQTFLYVSFKQLVSSRGRARRTQVVQSLQVAQPKVKKMNFF